MGVTVIRPLIYVEESDVIGFVNKNNLPVVKSPCPADGNTKREYVHQLLQQLNQQHHGVKNRMFTAICTGEINGFKDIPASSRIRKKGSINGNESELS